MDGSVGFLVGLLEDEGPPDVAWEDFAGPHGAALRNWQTLGFLATEPGMNPVPTCPHCDAGVPYQLDGRYLCNHCRSEVDARELLLWRLDREAFCRWLASSLRLRGEVARRDTMLWQLGTATVGGESVEIFVRRPGPLSDIGRSRLSAFRNVLVLFGWVPPSDVDRGSIRLVSLLELLRMEDALTVTDLHSLLRTRGNVRFDPASGILWVGDRRLGEVPPGSKEYYFLDCLARDLDHFVSYADIKRAILRQTGSRDVTEEATFCQRQKNRLKKKWVPQIDALLSTTNKADGYRLRGETEL